MPISSSKEIYKNINNSQYHVDEGRNVRVIRGLYVTGVWRPPHYIDATLFVSGIDGTTAEIADFTERTEHAASGSYVVGLSNVISQRPTLVKFSQRTEHIKPGGYVAGLIGVSTTPISSLKFSTVYNYAKPGSFTVGLQNVITPKVTVTKYRIVSNEYPPGPPVLTVTAISGAPATVNNIT
jgi:hypothetical protein